MDPFLWLEVDDDSESQDQLVVDDLDDEPIIVKDWINMH